MTMMNPYIIVELLVVDYIVQFIVFLVVLLHVVIGIHCAELLLIHSCCRALEMPIPDVAPPEFKRIW